MNLEKRSGRKVRIISSFELGKCYSFLHTTTFSPSLNRRHSPARHSRCLMLRTSHEASDLNCPDVKLSFRIWISAIICSERERKSGSVLKHDSVLFSLACANFVKSKSVSVTPVCPLHIYRPIKADPLSLSRCCNSQFHQCLNNIRWSKTKETTVRIPPPCRSPRSHCATEITIVATNRDTRFDRIFAIRGYAGNCDGHRSNIVAMHCVSKIAGFIEMGNVGFEHANNESILRLLYISLKVKIQIKSKIRRDASERERELGDQ